MRERDPSELEEQVEALRVVGPAPLPQRTLASALAEARDLSPSTARSAASRMCAGRRVMGLGDWRGVFLRLAPDEQLVLARGLLDGGALELRIDDHAGEDLGEEDAQARLKDLAHELVDLAWLYDAGRLDVLIDALHDIRARTVSP